MIRLLCSVLVACALTAGGAVAAHAEDEVGVSRDAVTWSESLPGALFDESVRWAPGDVRTSVFLVRNQAADPAILSIEVDSRDGDGLVRNEDIGLAARMDDGPWTGLDRVGDGYRFDRQDLGAGERSRVQVRAAFDPAATNESQRDALDLLFRVTLTDARAGGGPDQAGDGALAERPAATPDDGALPATGAPRLGWLLLFVTALIGCGLALVRRRRREEVDDE